MSTRRLSEEVAARGIDLKRPVLSNLENRRRATVSVAEILALADVLGVPPLLLVFPLGHDEKVEPLPGVEATPWAAVQWAIGERPLPDRQNLARGGAVIAQFRAHDRAVAIWRSARSAHPPFGSNADNHGDTYSYGGVEWSQQAEFAERQLVALRAQMRSEGLTPPALPPELTHIDHTSSDPPPPELRAEGGGPP